MKVQIICPLCNKKQDINVDENVKNSKHLTTISIPKNLICEHHFQAFVDKDFKVRSYQKVEIEIGKKNLIDKTPEEKFRDLF